MPLYEYYCKPCELTFTEARTIAEREKPAKCPQCKKKSHKIMSPVSFSGHGAGWFGKRRSN